MKFDSFLVTPPLRQAESGATVLSVTDAMLHGGIRIEEKNGKPNVGYWFSTDDWLEWTLEVHTEGPYKLTAEIAAPADSAGSTYEVNVGDQSLTVSVDPTGDWAKFKTVPIGTYYFRKGKNTIQFRAKTINGQALMNLRSLSLTQRPRG